MRKKREAEAAEAEDGREGEGVAIEGLGRAGGEEDDDDEEEEDDDP